MLLHPSRQEGRNDENTYYQQTVGSPLSVGEIYQCRHRILAKIPVVEEEVDCEPSVSPLCTKHLHLVPRFLVL